jgi:lipid A ethanolaminephosphotransferase
MNTYHVVIDSSMIRNTLQTDLHESSDLFSIWLVVYVLLLGVLPSLLIYKSKVVYRPWKNELFSKLKTIVLSMLIIFLMVFSFSKFYTSFFREHKPLRYYTNPTYWIYSIGNYIFKQSNSGPIIVKPIGVDANIDDNNSKKRLVIVVVGESARADHFSLDGYSKDTNPFLKKDDIINYSNFSSCGTSTAESVPCMFSVYNRGEYSYQKGVSTQNVLDILKRTKKVDILWRDNNSDSKGVALRVPYQNYKTAKNNTICEDKECRDIGMLVGLDSYIKKHRNKDILIILHQMGNHGPAYYKRYPKAFEKFKPVCKTNQLEQCSKEEINNAYDNVILYTDYFLDKTINFLKKYNDTYKTAMIYMSDHGESLGENGIYLHGMPYFMAPKEQKHIGSLIWLGNSMKKDIDYTKLKQNSNNQYSQDYLFHTLLGIFKVNTKVYNQKLDLLKQEDKNAK